jgi:alpha-L-fucosidase
MSLHDHTYEPTLSSLNSHPVPDWFEDAKFGIFVHWGLFSVPAFAPSLGTIGDVFAKHYDIAVAQTPYAEWYENAIKVPESDSARFHAREYGNASYDDFRAPFLKGLEHWDARAWARLFAKSGAKYVVLVTKHCDGYSLWPTSVAHPHKRGWHSERDIVGELAEAVRAEGLRFGLYYCGGMDWSFNPEPLRTLGEFMGSTPGGAFPAYAEAQVNELVERYRPSVLWNDVAWPGRIGSMMRTMAHYYNAVPDGVVNDRWIPMSWKTWLMRFSFVRRQFDKRVKPLLARRAQRGIVPPAPPHFDFRTPEYTSFPEVQSRKWETTRGMSHSFGYNRMDTAASYLSVDKIVHDFVDAVSKNGNLLLNVGPRGADAQIPPEQIARLEGFGAWMAINGEAMHGTRPWIRADDVTGEGLQVRFTRKGSTLYAILLGQPTTGEVTLPSLAPADGARVTLLGQGDVDWVRRNDGIVMTWPRDAASSPAAVFAIRGFEPK